MDLQPPALVTAIANDCRARGGRALLVGGGVRDALLGRQVADWDLEVYGLSEDALREVLGRHGRVDLVGKSFGVFKLQRGPLVLDVSIPRRDSKVGAGHRGIAVQGDPEMDVVEAARRRDLTINAILVDPLTHEVIDPYHGAADVEARVLRAVDRTTFLEDPLRALRVVQFAARLDFDTAPDLIDLCREAALDELPAERISGEWQKLLLKGVRPSRGLEVARASGILARVFPTVVDDPDSDARLDRLVSVRNALEPEGRRLALMLAAWFDHTPAAGITAAMDRLWLHKWNGYALRDKVLAAVAHRDAPAATDTDLRRLAVRAEPALVLAIRDEPAALARATLLGVATDKAAPLLQGRHLGALGVKPGPAMGKLLDAVYEAQLDGLVTTPDEASLAAKRLLA